jgi:hypothetical protein
VSSEAGRVTSPDGVLEESEVETLNCLWGRREDFLDRRLNQ